MTERQLIDWQRCIKEYGNSTDFKYSCGPDKAALFTWNRWIMGKNVKSRFLECRRATMLEF